VKKVNKIPYFETKVVKVKKERKNNNLCSPSCSWNGFCIHQKKRIGKKKCIISENRGNWVNDENLDKIKFPCFCRFDANKGMFGDPSKNYKVHGIGKIDKNFTEGQVQYQLSWADHQQENLSVLCETPSLKRLIEIYDIKIRKAKLIIFEEE